MQREAKVTSKGQITVPKAVRNALGLRPGDKVVFEQDGEQICVRPVRARSQFARFRCIGNPGMASGRKAVLRKIRELRGQGAEQE